MPTMVMMVGISGSGKSYFARNVAGVINTFGGNAKIFSSDDIRKEVYGDIYDQTHNQEVFQILHKRIKEFLRQSDDAFAIYDATNLSSKRRVAFLKELNKIDYLKKICVVIVTPIEKCIERQKGRELEVPINSIKRQYKSFSCPYWYEGWDDIIIHNDFLPIHLNVLLELCHFSQDNPHHKLYCDEHMKKAEELALSKTKDEAVILACKYHDLGKSYTKTYLDVHGNFTDVAHYYGHQNVSSYLVLQSTLVDTDLQLALKVAKLVELHMEFYLREEKGLNKLRELIGEELYKELEILHECDMQAH